MSWRITLAMAITASVVTVGAIVFIFQDNITKFLLNPRTPYQTYIPPPPPAYGARGAWALWPDQPHKGVADVFYVHSTTYASNRHWNAPLTDEKADTVLRRAAAPNEAGPFSQIGAIYGPRYRQATLFASFTHKFDGLAAHQLAFGDVEQAFLRFMMERRPDHPIILAGYGQGGLHMLGLLQKYFAADDALRADLAVAYVIGEPVPMALFDNALKTIPPCRSVNDTGCLVAFIDLEAGFKNERIRRRQRALIWDEDGALATISRTPNLCVNPISRKVSNELASAEAHLGAASATGLRMTETPPAISGAVSAQCDDGILTVSRPRQNFLRRQRWFGAQWRPQDFNLFYHDLAADAAGRVQNLSQAQNSSPHGDPVDLDASPVNKAPN